MNLGMIYEILNEPDRALESYAQSASLIAQHENESCLSSLINVSIILLQMIRIEDSRMALLKR